MASADYEPIVTLELSPEEARALVILIASSVKGASDPITDALFDIMGALFQAGINYDSEPTYVTYDIELAGTVETYPNNEDQTGISFRNAPLDSLTRIPDDTY